MMDMTIYDPTEVARLQARPDCHGAKMRFALHVEKVAPTHIWPHMFYAVFAEEPDERTYHLASAVEAGQAQLLAEREGHATRRRDSGEAKLLRHALYLYAQQSALMGVPSEAAKAVAQLLEIDPKDRLMAMAMAEELGVFPAQDAEVARVMRM